MKINKIKTINDILKVITSENYNRFTTDFMVTMHNLLKVKETLTLEERKEFKIKSFDWCDDNDSRIGYRFNDGEIIWSKDDKKEN